MSTRGRKWTPLQRRRFIRTMALRRAVREAPPVNPDLIYILVNGKLKPFRLRSMPVYLPEEELR